MLGVYGEEGGVMGGLGIVACSSYSGSNYRPGAVL